MNKRLILFICLIFAVGCGTNQPVQTNQNTVRSEPGATATTIATASPTPTSMPKSEKGHKHEHKAPRGGTLIVFGNDFRSAERIVCFADSVKICV